MKKRLWSQMPPRVRPRRPRKVVPEKPGRRARMVHWLEVQEARFTNAHNIPRYRLRGTGWFVLGMVGVMGVLVGADLMWGELGTFVAAGLLGYGGALVYERIIRRQLRGTTEGDSKAQADD